jgi:hypothetical protein
MNTVTLLKQTEAHQRKLGNNPRCNRSFVCNVCFRTIFCDYVRPR